MAKLTCSKCGGVKYSDMDINKKIYVQSDIHRIFLARNSERNSRAWTPEARANFYAVLNESEDYLRSKLDDGEFFCKCLSAELEKKLGRGDDPPTSNSFEKERHGMSSSEIEQIELGAIEWRLTNFIKNVK